jgi:SAM-dependent methyltransferase
MDNYMQIKTANQERIFVEKEADEWFCRNSSSLITPAPKNHRIMKSIEHVQLPERGILLDVGGATGRLSARFLMEYPGWVCRVVEPSAKAIAAGKEVFPEIQFYQASITQPGGMPWADVDLIIVSGVLCWVDRLLLSRAVANLDGALRDGGLVVISDFDSPSLKANAYKHHAELFTFKQDYAKIFEYLGIYHLVFRESQKIANHSVSDQKDCYDQHWVTTVLRKDLLGRYFKA